MSTTEETTTAKGDEHAPPPPAEAAEAEGAATEPVDAPADRSDKSAEAPKPSNGDAKNAKAAEPTAAQAASYEDKEFVAPAPKKKGKKTAEIAVRLTKVTKRFGVKTAVDGISLKIKAGSVYGLIGPNGAGKTTTFSMMAGFLQPTEGAVEVLGFTPSHVDELRGRLGVLPQDALLPNTDTVGEFLSHMAALQDIPSDKIRAEVESVLAEVDGRDWMKLRCSQLSHGMAKRVQLAQALLGEPEVVLLDEPTAGLDPRVAYEVRQIIKSRKGRCTLIVSSHNLQELEEVCDGAAILDRGRVVAHGSIAELTASSQEVHIKLAPGPVPLQELRALPMIKRVEFDDEKSEIAVYFERGTVDAETVIGQVLWVLLNNQARISGVTKGKGLEQRVMELT
ncbi:MAG: ABC transporter ATP-binding protein [Myxococcales bacterium]|jgi:ABC-type multidrug transport system ATPase subunit|nr:ABC transporter ATP-binding protein [Myxococcales bacterium]MBL0195610.1 ABC transporter ATP-binding protein [Myxococcales bacterium]HQY62672.1 ABC transporter ATP-binding protein [Polyangiaceae bacterium]